MPLDQARHVLDKKFGMLTIPGEEFDRSVRQKVDLGPLPIILELSLEVALQLAQCIWYALAYLGQHRLQGDPCGRNYSVSVSKVACKPAANLLPQLQSFQDHDLEVGIHIFTGVLKQFGA